MNTIKALSWIVTAICMTFVAAIFQESALAATAERFDGRTPPLCELGLALEGRPDVAKPLASLGGAVMDGSLLSHDRAWRGGFVPHSSALSGILSTYPERTSSP